MNDPTVLDFIKSIFSKEKRIPIGPIIFEEDENNLKNFIKEEKRSPKKEKLNRFLVPGICIAIIAQLYLEPPQTKPITSIFIYAVSLSFFYMYFKKNNFDDIVSRNPYSIKPVPDFKVNLWFLFPGLIFIGLAFLNFKDNQFTLLNLSLWIPGVILCILSEWQSEEKRQKISLSPTPFLFLVLAVVLVSAFYRFHLLNQVPGEMFSDHAEKLLDVIDVLNGKTSIFFTRNTGREAFQFYLTAAIIKIFGTGITFASLKTGTILIGFLTLPYIFLLGKLIYNKWVGITAAFFAGIAYWPNVISRVGLRFPLYPFFTAAALFYLFKGLKEKKYNSFIISGLSIGLGLQGYSPFRIVPILVLVIFLIFIVFEKDKSTRIFGINGFLIMALSAFIIFLPLFRYALENPAGFNSRILTRLTSVESPIIGSIPIIFFTNLAKSLVMFFYRNGVVWVNSIPNRPALDIISAVFFIFGLLIVIKEALKQKSWEALSLLVAIPVLMLPSILALAFPQENPALNRSSGVITIVFILIGSGFFNFVQHLIIFEKKLFKKVIGILLASSLIILSMIQNYDLVFNQYAAQFLGNAWNSSEMGEVIFNFVDNGNNTKNAFVIPYPHWVDTRLVGINSGFPDKDYALRVEDVELTQSQKGKKIYLIKPEDRETLDKLKLIYPLGEESIFYSKIPGKNFVIFTVDV
jgi:hypothetical protein